MTPTYIIIYEGKDVSKDFAPFLESVTFKEYLENKAAELELVFTNAEAYFFSDWYPAIDDRLTAKLGYKEGQVINAGVFFVDDVTLSGSRSGDTCSFRAISALASTIYSSEMRQNREAKPLKALVESEAAKLGYKVKGDLTGNWSGIQKGTGLKFMEQIARETGRIMKVEGSDLIFYLRSEIKKGPVVGTVSRGEVIGYSITDKAAGRIGKCIVKCWKKTTKQLIEGTYDAKIKGGGSRTVWEDVDDTAAAIERAKNYVEEWNKDGMKLELNLTGDVKYRAGVQVKTIGFGRFDKTWYVSEVQHTISKSGGYVTKITLQV